MKRFFRIALAAAAVAFVGLPAGFVLAEETSSGGTTTPAATTPAATTTTPPDATSKETADKPPAKKAKKTTKMTRQQEIDKSVESGTVPARYRSRIPKQYQQYIPFDKQ